MEDAELNLILRADEEAGADDEGERAGRVSAEDGFEFEFDPTEDELVLYFLRPQLRGFPPRVAGAVLEADPCGAAPWELLARYGLRERGHFFAARARGRPRPPDRRAVAGSSGAWLHSSSRCGRSVTELGVVVAWSRARFCFFVRAGAQLRDAGWVMEEYEVTDPRCYRRDEEGEEDDYWVLCRVRRIGRPAAAAAAAKARCNDERDLESDSNKPRPPLRT